MRPRGWVSYDGENAHRCRTPGHLLTFLLKAGSVWSCRRCGQCFVLERPRNPPEKPQEAR